MAVAIAALGIITLLGLIPHGLSTSRKTINEIATTRIVAQLVAEAQLADWQSLDATTDDTSRLFDDQGVEIQSGSGNMTTLSYVARVGIPAKDVILPTNSNAAVSQNLRRVIIDVAPVPDQNFFKSNPAPESYRTFTQLISNMR